MERKIAGGVEERAGRQAALKNVFDIEVCGGMIIVIKQIIDYRKVGRVSTVCNSRQLKSMKYMVVVVVV